MNKKIVMGLWLLAISAISISQTTNAGSLSFYTETETAIKNCPMQVDILLDTEWEEVNSIDLGVILNDSFEVNEVKSDDWVLRAYSKPKSMTARMWNFEWKEVMSMLASTNSPNWYKGEWKLLSLTVTPKSDVMDLEFYMVKWNEWEDTNLMTKKWDKIVDILNSVWNKKIKVTEWECWVEPLEKINLSWTETTVLAEEVEDIVAENTEINKDVIFDESQKTNIIKEYWLYIAIVLVAIVLVFILVSKNKKKK